MQRDDYHATRDTAVLFGLILASGYAAYRCWQQGSYGLFALFFWAYCTLYTSSGDSRWHECGHGTAFRTKWKNDLLCVSRSSQRASPRTHSMCPQRADATRGLPAGTTWHPSWSSASRWSGASLMPGNVFAVACPGVTCVCLHVCVCYACACARCVCVCVRMWCVGCSAATRRSTSALLRGERPLPPAHWLALLCRWLLPLAWGACDDGEGRWRSCRHHTDTDIIGRDPEIDGRPLDM